MTLFYHFYTKIPWRRNPISHEKILLLIIRWFLCGSLLLDGVRRRAGRDFPSFQIVPRESGGILIQTTFCVIWSWCRAMPQLNPRDCNYTLPTYVLVIRSSQRYLASDVFQTKTHEELSKLSLCKILCFLLFALSIQV